jgi:hypothetical protein
MFSDTEDIEPVDRRRHTVDLRWKGDQVDFHNCRGSDMIFVFWLFLFNNVLCDVVAGLV